MTRRKTTPAKVISNVPRAKVACQGCRSIKQRCERISEQDACVRCQKTEKPCIEEPSTPQKSRRGPEHSQAGSSSSLRFDREFEGLHNTDSAPNSPKSSPTRDFASSETEGVNGDVSQKAVGMYELMHMSYGISRGLAKWA